MRAAEAEPVAALLVALYMASCRTSTRSQKSREGYSEGHYRDEHRGLSTLIGIGGGTFTVPTLVLAP